jgi:hypothetical protein
MDAKATPITTTATTTPMIINFQGFFGGGGGGGTSLLFNLNHCRVSIFCTAFVLNFLPLNSDFDLSNCIVLPFSSSSFVVSLH